ncbi:MAG: iron ABC transporter permease [Kofleriaceae bacterium]
MSSFVSGSSSRRLTGKRLVVILVLSLIACAAIAVLALLFGRGSDHHFELLGRSAFDDTSIDHQILFGARLPRVLACVVTGAALAGAGCALQALLRNPLADPFTLGISSGSSLGAVVAIRFGAERAFGYGAIGVAALLGAVATLVVIWKLAQVGRHLPPATLILAGVAIAMFCSSASVLIQYTSDFTDIEHMLGWMMGGLDAVRLQWVEYATLPIGGGLVVLMLYGKEMNALAAGAEVAASLGVRVARTQLVLFAVSSLLVGSAIAVVGPIGFVGLVVPHGLRAIIGPDHRALLPASMFGGAIVLSICDTLARTIIPMHHLPTGAVTAVIGVPLFFGILIANKQKASLWGRA